MLSPSGNYLGIDSSTGACSVAVLAGERVLAHGREEMSRGQSERLVPMLEAAMRQAGLGFEVLDAIVVTRGPGSFTGVRIGMATAKGLGQALGIPTLGITGFDAVCLAASGTGEGHLAVVLESRRADLFFQLYGPGGVPVGAPEARPADSIADRLAEVAGTVLLAGDAAAAVHARGLEKGIGSFVLSPVMAPDAREVALLAARGGHAVEGAALKPLYLRAPDVTKPRTA